MITCPRCGHSVDETRHTHCPDCLTPFAPQTAASQQGQPAPPAGQAQPPTGPIPLAGSPLHARPAAQDLNAASAPPAAQGQTAGPPPTPRAPQPAVRRTLAGEIIEEAPPVAAPPQPGGYAGSAPPSASSELGVRPAPPHAITMARRQERPAASRSSSGPLAAILGVVVLLALAGFGGWWFYTHRGPSPKEQADKFFTAVKTLDFRTIYHISAIDTRQFPTEDSFVQKSKENLDRTSALLSQLGAGQNLIQDALSNMSVTTGQPTINGNDASVPYTLKTKVMGKDFNQSGNLQETKADGIWKISLQNGQIPGAGLPGGMGGGASGQPGGP